MSLSRAQVNELASACLALGNEAADSDGFVAVRKLLARFDAELVLRPMLVEAMLCESTDARSLAAGAARWRLLVDSEKYPLSLENLDTESRSAPLPARFRNTVAHELTHSLAYRAKEFGVDLALPTQHGKQSAASIVKDIENQTEALSPLLLAPERAIERWFPSTRERLTMEDLREVRQAMGISRFVLIQRLNLLRTHGSGHFIERRCFSNVVIGVGGWTHEGVPVLRGQPMFVNFDGNEAPAFVYTLRRSKSMAAASLTDNPFFVLNGGNTASFSMVVPAGTEKNPNRASITAELSVENAQRRLGGSFFFMMCGAPRPLSP